MKKLTIVVSSIAIFIIIGVIVFLAAAGYFFYSFSLANDAARKNGVEFGRTTTQQGCVDESVRQFATFKEQNIFTRTEEMHIAKFTTACLTTCKPTKDFCSSVPPPSKFKLPLEWEMKKCGEVGLDINGPCHSIYAAVTEECAKTHEKVVNYPDR